MSIPILTKYEFAKIKGIRLQQLVDGFEPKVDTTPSDTIESIFEKELKEKIVKFRDDELHHKDIAYDNGATKKGLFGVLDKVIKTSSRIAITISEKI